MKEEKGEEDKRETVLLRCKICGMERKAVAGKLDEKLTMARMRMHVGAHSVRELAEFVGGKSKGLLNDYIERIEGGEEGK